MELCAFLRRISSVALVTAAAASCGSEFTSVTIRTGEPPALIAFRDEADLKWQLLPVDGLTTFEIAVTRTYQVLVVCVTPGDERVIDSALYARTSEDERSFEAQCGHTHPFNLYGWMVQPGVVIVGGHGWASNQMNWSFALPASRGTFDAIVLSTGLSNQPEGVAFRRDIVITGNADLEPIDLAEKDVHSLTPMTFTAANLRPGESVAAGARLFAGGTSASLTLAGDGVGPTVMLAPDGALRPADRQSVTVSALAATDGTTTRRRARGTQRDVRASDSTSFVLPEPFGHVAFVASPSGLAAKWASLPDYDELLLSRYSASLSSSGGLELRLHRASHTRSFIEGIGGAAATFDVSEVPDFRSEWQLDPAAHEFRSFTAVRRPTATEERQSTVSEVVLAPGEPTIATPRPTTWWSVPGLAPLGLLY